MSLRVMVVDDQGIVRAGFAAVIDAEEDMTVVGEAADGATAVVLAAELAPDVVVMDVRMPELDGIAATRIITGKENAPRVLVLTTFDLDAYVFDALRAGASGFLLKDVHASELLDGIRVVASGESVLAPSATRRLIGHYASGAGTGFHSKSASDASSSPGSPGSPGSSGSFSSSGSGPRELESLTDSQRNVLGLLASGLNNAEIAGELGITVGTVKSHVNALLRKLGLRDRVQATILAYDLGITRPNPPGADHL